MSNPRMPGAFGPPPIAYPGSGPIPTTPSGVPTSDAALAALTQQVADFLDTEAVRKIDFTFQYVTASPDGFKSVASALRSGKITLEIRNLDGSKGLHNSGTNVITFPHTRMTLTPGGRATIVHEAVHASADLAAQKLDQRNNRKIEETVGFVAGAWYLLSCGITEQDGYRPEFFAAAKSIREKGDKYGYPVELAGDDAISALGALDKFYNYSDGAYLRDGVGR